MSLVRLLSCVLALSFLACATARPVTGPAARDVPGGADAFAAADARWVEYIVAHEVELQAALAQADAADPTVVPAQSARQSDDHVDRAPLWDPERQRFVFQFMQTRTVRQSWLAPGEGGCTKYQGLALPPAPQPARQPCPPPIPIVRMRSHSATIGLVLEYADGKLVSERAVTARPVRQN